MDWCLFLIDLLLMYVNLKKSVYLLMNKIYYTPRYEVYGSYIGFTQSVPQFVHPSICRHFLGILFLRNHWSKFHETS